MMILDAVKSLGVDLARVATTAGGEYAGPCPVCGGRDRFRVWPAEEGGRWWCRTEAKSGDLIELFRWARGLSYRDACQAAGLDPKSFEYTGPRVGARDRSSNQAIFSPKTHEPPCGAWSEHAARFVLSCAEELLTNAAALNRLHAERGIHAETVRQYALGMNSADAWRPRESWGLPPEQNRSGKPKRLWLPRGLVIPCVAPDGSIQRIRVRRPKSDLRSDADPRFFVVPGSAADIMRIGEKSQIYAVLESELDALLIAQEAGDLLGVVAMGSASTKPDAAAWEHLRQAKLILVALDADQAGEKASIWWLEQFSQAKRWPVPIEKDPGDCFKTVNLRAWLMAGLPKERIGSCQQS